MKKLNININAAVFLASLCAVFVLAAAPVFAQDGGSGSDDSTSSSDQKSSDVNDDSGSGKNETENETENEAEVHNSAERLREKAREHVQELRSGKALKSVAQRQKTCEKIQNAVNRKLTAFNDAANKHLTRLDSVFTKLQAYQTANNLPVSNYDSLVAAATTKQAAATLAVQTLGSVGGTIDCSSSDPGSMLGAAKEAAAAARSALKEYRSALKDIVVALAHAQSDDNSTDTTEGSN